MEDDGCGLLDRLFVIHAAGAAASGYKRDEIERLALESIEHIARFRKPDGGFSFEVSRAQRRYYGAFVSLGGSQSDMHGAVMLTWATARSIDLLGVRQEAGWRISIP